MVIAKFSAAMLMRLVPLRVRQKARIQKSRIQKADSMGFSRYE
ncbi:hypothetical protein [Scytonema sp. HK-05]|nr:hypothetical protein [Scytonema sp. HK-05]